MIQVLAEFVDQSGDLRPDVDNLFGFQCAGCPNDEIKVAPFDLCGGERRRRRRAVSVIEVISAPGEDDREDRQIDERSHGRMVFLTCSLG